MNDVKVQVIRGSQLIREALYLDTLSETYLSITLPNGKSRDFKTPTEPNETVLYGAGDCNVVISSTSTKRLFLVHIINQNGEKRAEGNFNRLPDAESWALRALAEQRLFHPKDILRAEITPLSEKEAEKFMSDYEEESGMLDEV